MRSEEHTSELQSRGHIVCRLLLEKKKSERRSAKPCSAWLGRIWSALYPADSMVVAADNHVSLQPTILSSFFFYSYAHNRDLHSFPTRRSSDLVIYISSCETVDGLPVITHSEEMSMACSNKCIHEAGH